MPSRDRARPSMVILVADGARPDTLAAAMDRGELPALARLRSEGALHEVTSVFPSVTVPAYAPFLVGRFPGPVGLPGLRWFDRARTATSFPGWSRSYVGIGMLNVNRDLSAATPTIFELVRSSVAALSVIDRGLRRRDRVGRGIAFVARSALAHFRGHLPSWLAIERDLASQFADRVDRERPEFAFCALLGIDKSSHKTGHDSAATRAAFRGVDATAARLRDDAERAGRWDAMHLWIVSDHGHSPVRAHDDLAALLRSWNIHVLAHPWLAGPPREAAVMVSGNAMANVYLDVGRRDRPWWPALAGRWEPLVERLLERESVDLVLLPRSAGECEVRARGRGTARILVEGGRFSYRPGTGDPLGIGEVAPCSSGDALAATRRSTYPDSLVQVARLAGSPRAGDVILSAAPGWDFRARWEPISHVSTHGSLHRDHMLVPLLVNRPAGRLPQRTVDVMPSALAALGRPIPAGLDGRSWLA